MPAIAPMHKNLAIKRQAHLAVMRLLYLSPGANLSLVCHAKRFHRNGEAKLLFQSKTFFGKLNPRRP
jgi:hypothetical protein